MTKIFGFSFCVIFVTLLYFSSSTNAEPDAQDLEELLNELGLTKFLQFLKDVNLHELIHQGKTMFKQGSNLCLLL